MGIGDKYFKKFNKEKIRKKLKLDLKKKYILYLGRIKSTKGIKELLDSIGKFENEDLELLLVGEGSDSEKYKNYLVENGIKNARFLGAIYGDAKLDYLAACNCLILPSYTEGAPVVLMEAIARNLPVIATNVGGIPKMIKGGREGIIIKPKSKDDIVRAIKEILKWKKKSISEFAEKYKWGKIIKETLADYKR
jgi:glycosyltransferase involved in cell wall biosynthesis